MEDGRLDLPDDKLSKKEPRKLVRDPSKFFSEEVILCVFTTLGAGAAAFAGGIYVGSPLVSGEASVFRDNLGTERMSLSSDQLQAMAHWLEQRPSAWQGDPIEASPNERVELQIKLNHANDGVTTLSVIPWRARRPFLAAHWPWYMGISFIFWALQDLGGHAANH